MFTPTRIFTATLVVIAAVNVAMVFGFGGGSDDRLLRATGSAGTVHATEAPDARWTDVHPSAFAPGSPLDAAARFAVALRTANCDALVDLTAHPASVESCDSARPVSSVVVHSATLRALITPHADVPEAGNRLTADVDLKVSETPFDAPETSSQAEVAVELEWVDDRWLVSEFAWEPSASFQHPVTGEVVAR